MPLNDKQWAVGREGFIQTNGLEISVIIRDARIHPQSVDYLVEPTAGTGKVWIDSNQVHLIRGQE